MGHIRYGSHADRIEMDDRALSHVKVVMLAKLRRNEAFAFSWDTGASGGSGRDTIWIHPRVDLWFSFVGSRRPTLNRTWIDALMLTANSVDGLRLVEEPPDAATGAIPTQAPADLDGSKAPV